MTMLDLVWLIPAFPLVGFVVLLVGGRILGEPRAGWLATLMSAGSFGTTVVVFIGLLAEDAEHRVHELVLFDWLPWGTSTLKPDSWSIRSR